VYGYSQPYGIPAWGTYGYSMTPNQPATIQTAPAQPGQAVPVPYLLPGQPALPANPATSPTPAIQTAPGVSPSNGSTTPIPGTGSTTNR
jgi:hypothetical protein